MTDQSVSIVIASYNYAAYLGQAIESALSQLHQPVEIIVVDDGSTDGSLEVARRYPVDLVAKKNQGVCIARNVGAERASGSYLMFLDADDVLETTYVARCVEVLEKASANVAYAYTQMRMFGAESGIYPSRSFDRKALLKGNFVNVSALMRRSAFVAAGGFDPSWDIGMEDHELWVRMLSLDLQGVYIPEPLLHYRRHIVSRNSLTLAQNKLLMSRLRGTYPRLYLGRGLMNPLKFLYWIWRARRMLTSDRR